jgi:transcriptional regulator with XRE-family HTH domain
MERFGEKIRALRQRDGISLRKLAAMLGHSSHSLVASLEKGEKKPSAELVVRIADIFNVTTDQLLRDDQEVG